MVTSQIKDEITEQFNIYKQELGIQREVPLLLDGEGDVGEYSKRGVQIKDGVMTQWINYPQRTKFVLIHELIHAKFNEVKNPFLGTPIVFPSIVLLYLLREIRANTIAYQVLGCNDSILEDYFLNYYPNLTNSYIHAISAGYVCGNTNVGLIKGNPIWNGKAIEDAIEFFTTEFPYLKRTSLRKIEQIKRSFIEQL
ncbi:hypothetical protein ACIQXW_02390 [Lysinibacillus sp. NPDC097162]|uniref:hypothetical protein n=1 Tax=Lysinibacillus sp. NPDC097162 TaxID=3364140 RepID=UPI00380FCC9B